MNRRALLRMTAAGILPLSAGCLGSLSENEDEPEPPEPLAFDLGHSLRPDSSFETVVEIEAVHTDSGVHYSFISPISIEYERYVERIRDEGWEPMPFSEAMPRAQQVSLWAIVQRGYLSPPNLQGESLPTVNFGGTIFGFERVAAGGNGYDPNWTVPFELDATLEAGALTLIATNTSEETYYARPYGEPYFGVLMAWDGDPHLLGHEAYETNWMITTEDGAVRRTSTESYRQPIELASGDSVADAYSVPEGLIDEAKLWFYLPFRSTEGLSQDSHSGQAVWTVTIGP